MHSPSPSIFDRSTSLDAGAGTASGSSENPFVHPSERTLTPVTPTPTLPPSALPSPSPFADPHAQQALQANPTTRLSVENKTHARKRPSRSGVLFVPPPEAIQQVKPLQPTSQPVLRPPPPPREDPEERAVRWWHDWLCGCSEGPDRGGDNQVRRVCHHITFGRRCLTHTCMFLLHHRLVVRIRLNNLVANRTLISLTFTFSLYHPSSFTRTITTDPCIIYFVEVVIRFPDVPLVLRSIFSTLHTLLIVYSLLLVRYIAADIVI